MKRRAESLIWGVALATAVYATLYSSALLAHDPEFPDTTRDWLVIFSTDSSELGTFDCVGRFTASSGRNMESEDRVVGTSKKFEAPWGATAIFKTSLPPSEIERICRRLSRFHSFQDHVWLENGDAFACEFLRFDKRFVYLRAFDVDVRVPRGRVVALRFRDAAPEKSRTNQNR